MDQDHHSTITPMQALQITTMDLPHSPILLVEKTTLVDLFQMVEWQVSFTDLELESVAWVKSLPEAQLLRELRTDRYRQLIYKAPKQRGLS